VFTGREGKYVPLAETIRGFAEILDGKHDELPEEAFYMCGTIDEALQRAAALKGDDDAKPAPAAAAAETPAADSAETEVPAATAAPAEAAAQADAATDAALATDVEAAQPGDDADTSSAAEAAAADETTKA
jgi:hypothetical protein